MLVQAFRNQAFRKGLSENCGTWKPAKKTCGSQLGFEQGEFKLLEKA
jgi:hypothetical protein